jgi:hypothetical protein
MKKARQALAAVFILSGCSTLPRAPTTEVPVATQAPHINSLIRSCYTVTETMGDGTTPDTETRWLRKICGWYQKPQMPSPTFVRQAAIPDLRAEN